MSTPTNDMRIARLITQCDGMRYGTKELFATQASPTSTQMVPSLNAVIREAKDLLPDCVAIQALKEVEQTSVAVSEIYSIASLIQRMAIELRSNPAPFVVVR